MESSLQHEKSKEISIKLEKIQNFEAKTAFDNWKKLGSKSK